MPEHPNVELLRRGFAAWAAGDMATLGGMFADEAIMHVPGRTQWAGDYEGKAAIFQYFADSMQSMQDVDSFEWDIHAVLADDEHGVVLMKASATRGDDRLEANNVMVFHLGDGLVREVWGASTDPYAGDEFWA